mgnify:CR=1 FL=1
MGITDVLLLEQNQLTSGTTWHAAGLVGQLRASQNMTRLAQYTTELFQSLSVETGLETGYQRTGSFTLAMDVERLEELKASTEAVETIFRPHLTNFLARVHVLAHRCALVRFGVRERE